MTSLKKLNSTGKNSIEVKYEFVRENTKKANSDGGGLFERVCVCTIGFDYSQGISSHQLACETKKAQS